MSCNSASKQWFYLNLMSVWYCPATLCFVIYCRFAILLIYACVTFGFYFTELNVQFYWFTRVWLSGFILQSSTFYFLYCCTWKWRKPKRCAPVSWNRKKVMQLSVQDDGVYFHSCWVFARSSSRMVGLSNLRSSDLFGVTATKNPIAKLLTLHAASLCNKISLFFPLGSRGFYGFRWWQANILCGIGLWQ